METLKAVLVSIFTIIISFDHKTNLQDVSMNYMPWK